MYTAVLILNYNNAKDTINCIRSVQQYNTAAIRYVVVENGSNAETISAVSNFLKSTFGADYYLRRYESLSLIQKVLWSAANVLFCLKNLVHPLFKK